MRFFRSFTLYLLRSLKGTSIVRAVLDCTSAHWKQAFLWAFSTAVGSFMPIWGALFLLRLHKVSFVWADFARHGEFGLYAAALLAPSVYQILTNIRREKFALQGGSVFLAIVGILMAAFIYAGTNPQFAPNTAVQAGTIDETYLMGLSGTLLSLAFVFSFFVTLIDSAANDPDLGLADKVNQDFLRAAVAMDQPEASPGSAEVPTPDAGTIPSNEDLARRFNPVRAGDDVNG